MAVVNYTRWNFWKVVCVALYANQCALRIACHDPFYPRILHTPPIFDENVGYCAYLTGANKKYTQGYERKTRMRSMHRSLAMPPITLR